MGESRHFVATTRLWEASRASWGHSLQRDDNGDVRLGLGEVHLPASPAEKSSVRTLSVEAFMAALNPWSACLVFVHGFNHSHASAVGASADFARSLDSMRGAHDLAHIAFTWASKSSPRAYLRDRVIARDSVPALADLLCLLRQLFPGRVHVVAHSMGCQLLFDALRIVGPAGWGTLSLVAADVGASDVAATYAHVGVPCTSYHCPSDRALDVSRILYNSGRRLGSTVAHVTADRKLVVNVRVPKALVKLEDPTNLHTYVNSPAVVYDIATTIGARERLGSSCDELLHGEPSEQRHLVHLPTSIPYLRAWTLPTGPLFGAWTATSRTGLRRSCAYHWKGFTRVRFRGALAPASVNLTGHSIHIGPLGPFRVHRKAGSEVWITSLHGVALNVASAINKAARKAALPLQVGPWTRARRDWNGAHAIWAPQCAGWGGAMGCTVIGVGGPVTRAFAPGDVIVIAFRRYVVVRSHRRSPHDTGSTLHVNALPLCVGKQAFALHANVLAPIERTNERLGSPPAWIVPGPDQGAVAVRARRSPDAPGFVRIHVACESSLQAQLVSWPYVRVAGMRYAVRSCTHVPESSSDTLFVARLDVQPLLRLEVLDHSFHLNKGLTVWPAHPAHTVRPPLGTRDVPRAVCFSNARGTTTSHVIVVAHDDVVMDVGCVLAYRGIAVRVLDVLTRESATKDQCEVWMGASTVGDMGVVDHALMAVHLAVTMDGYDVPCTMHRGDVLPVYDGTVGTLHADLDTTLWRRAVARGWWQPGSSVTYLGPRQVMVWLCVDRDAVPGFAPGARVCVQPARGPSNYHLELILRRVAVMSSPVGEPAGDGDVGRYVLVLGESSAGDQSAWEAAGCAGVLDAWVDTTTQATKWVRRSRL